MTEYKVKDLVPLLGLPLIAALFRPALPPWAFMWLIAFSLFIGCKYLTWSRMPTRPNCRTALNYFFLWPGMDPRAFAEKKATVGKENVFPALLVTMSGFALLLLTCSVSLQFTQLWAGWMGMIGIILFLHFGLFELLAIYWRTKGLRARSIMNHPLRATSLAEFWGGRWNTAFNALATEYIFTPFAKHLRKTKIAPLRRTSIPLATMSVFAASGLVHELVISFPARGGYGLPTTYFLLQGFAVLFERSKAGRAIGLGHGWRGWLFTAICAGGPVFWLFHPPFVRNVILPMFQTLVQIAKAHL